MCLLLSAPCTSDRKESKAAPRSSVDVPNVDQAEKKASKPPTPPKSLPRFRVFITRYNGILRDYAMVAGCDYRSEIDWPSGKTGIGRETAVNLVCSVADATGQSSSLDALAAACAKKSKAVRDFGVEKILAGFQKIELACSAVVYDPIF